MLTIRKFRRAPFTVDDLIRLGTMTVEAAALLDACVRSRANILISGGTGLPVRAIRQQIGSAIDVIVQIARQRDGARRVTSITEVIGTEGDVVTMQEVFALDVRGTDSEGRLITEPRSTGVRSRTVDRMWELDLPVPEPLARLLPRPPRRGAAAR